MTRFNTCHLIHLHIIFDCDTGCRHRKWRAVHVQIHLAVWLQVLEKRCLAVSRQANMMLGWFRLPFKLRIVRLLNIEKGWWWPHPRHSYPVRHSHIRENQCFWTVAYQNYLNMWQRDASLTSTNFCSVAGAGLHCCVEAHYVPLQVSVDHVLDKQGHPM